MHSNQLFALFDAISVAGFSSSKFGVCRDVWAGEYFAVDLYGDKYLAGDWLYIYDWSLLFDSYRSYPSFFELPVPVLSLRDKHGAEVSLFKL